MRFKNRTRAHVHAGHRVADKYRERCAAILAGGSASFSQAYVSPRAGAGALPPHPTVLIIQLQTPGTKRRKVMIGERQRYRETETDRERQSDRDTERQRDRETDRDRATPSIVCVCVCLAPVCAVRRTCCCGATCSDTRRDNRLVPARGNGRSRARTSTSGRACPGQVRALENMRESGITRKGSRGIVRLQNRAVAEDAPP